MSSEARADRGSLTSATLSSGIDHWNGLSVDKAGTAADTRQPSWTSSPCAILSLRSLQAAKEALCSHKAARHIALHLLAPSTKRYLPAHAAAMLTPAALSEPAANSAPAAAVGGSKQAGDEKDEDEEDVDRVGLATQACPSLISPINRCEPVASILHGCKSMPGDCPVLSLKMSWQVCTEAAALTAGPLSLPGREQMLERAIALCRMIKRMRQQHRWEAARKTPQCGGRRSWGRALSPWGMRSQRLQLPMQPPCSRACSAVTSSWRSPVGARQACAHLAAPCRPKFSAISIMYSFVVSAHCLCQQHLSCKGHCF